MVKRKAGKCLIFKGLEYAKDLLLGNSQWRTLSHMPCAGLFQDKIKLNLFHVKATFCQVFFIIFKVKQLNRV